jgi:arsenate reductase (glutaredoxin)
MTKKIYIHPRCSTCKKAVSTLSDDVIIIDILETPPTEAILHTLIERNGIRSSFNTSGQRYRELNLKEKMDTISKNEALSLLKNDPMLIKRPVLVDTDENIYISGYKKRYYEPQD